MHPIDALEKHIGYSGRMKSGSKSGPPTVYWNACVFTEDGAQVWHGDIDPIEEALKLQAAANACATTLLVTPEHPFRFGGLKGGSGAFERQSSEDRKRIVRFYPEV